MEAKSPWDGRFDLEYFAGKEVNWTHQSDRSKMNIHSFCI